MLLQKNQCHTGMKFSLQKAGNRKRCLWFILMLLVMAIIFIFSSQNGETSSEVSSFAEKILAFLHIDWLITPGMVHGIGISVRKWAHIYVYMALGITSSMWIGTWQLPVWKRGSLAAVICCAYSATDEFHQTFVPGRCGTWRDMIYDGSGWLAGILLVLAAAGIYSRYCRKCQ
jgi:VanZ family protein